MLPIALTVVLWPGESRQEQYSGKSIVQARTSPVRGRVEELRRDGLEERLGREQRVFPKFF